MRDRRFEFEIVIVGAGPAGLGAACAAAESGRRVAVVEDTPWLGGQVWRADATRPAGGPARRWIERARRSGAEWLTRTTVLAAGRPGVLLAEHPDGPREIHWQRLILATGARELFLPFPGWTLPGVIGPGGLQALAKHGWPVDDRRCVVAGSGPLLLAVADGLRARGARVAIVAEQAPPARVAGFGLRLLAHPGKCWQALGLQARLLGIPYRCGVWPARAEGDEQVRRVVLTDGQAVWSVDCDLLACGFGLVPNVELPLALGCALRDGFVSVDEWQATTVPGVYCAGEPTGIGGAECALVEGRIAGFAAGDRRDRTASLFDRRAAGHRFRAALARTFALREELKSLAMGDTLICRCEDVTLGRVRSFTGWREAKLQTRCGMGPCQGRICGDATRVILGWGSESVRPPILPAQVQSLILEPE